MSKNFYAVTDEEELYWEGVQLCKLSGGWKPMIQWHDGCSCHCESLHYRNWDEFKEFVDHHVVKDEFGEIYPTDEFIEKLESWQENNRRNQDPHSDTWIIDGWNFCRGDWS